MGWRQESYGFEGMEPLDVVEICEVDLCVVYSYHRLLWSVEREIKSINCQKFSPKYIQTLQSKRFARLSIYFSEAERIYE